MVVGAAQVLMLDEITNGLDAASALTICKALRSTCEQTNATIVATLLQPLPEVVACFHDVILVSQGVVAYHGPTERLAPFLGSLGLAANAEAGQTMADFAQEVLSSPEDQAKYRLPQPPPPALQLAWQGLKWISPRRMRQLGDLTDTFIQLPGKETTSVTNYIQGAYSCERVDGPSAAGG
ncbi:hypothetical protein HYH02_001207 [Chlamydomonas schloesseri]|uniref:ABC transporter family G domain-containing protein n=1 Tax=Chlamydomonas schloesseri TaxID=2026947 RepID=A0A835WVH1_9CHLO|nr:hypothetical protein HYH02_001207 [Chlamydomonas schloesseri]|eukprot:KAG2454172.1 hypothetical protein HYH02_001207 [Chlamydomonas schloesseri]